MDRYSVDGKDFTSVTYRTIVESVGEDFQVFISLKEGQICNSRLELFFRFRPRISSSLW